MYKVHVQDEVGYPNTLGPRGVRTREMFKLLEKLCYRLLLLDFWDFGYL